jgi:hypothetical protein
MLEPIYASLDCASASALLTRQWQSDASPDSAGAILSALLTSQRTRSWRLGGVQCGVLKPHLGVGFTAGDEECFELFKDMIYPIVKGWHKFDPYTEVTSLRVEGAGAGGAFGSRRVALASRLLAKLPWVLLVALRAAADEPQCQRASSLTLSQAWYV